MNAHTKLKTDRRLWLVFGVVAFALFGFVSTMPGGVEGKVGPTSLWGVFFDGWRWFKGWHYPLHLVFHATLTAVPAAVVGWVAQAVVVSLRTRSP
jgi:hypothetical protein